jgi:polygalacturonase
MEVQGGAAVDEATSWATLTCDVVDFGAKGDGHTVDTTAIQKAIATCSNRHVAGAPRSKVVLGHNGTYVSGPIRLLSHVELLIEGGSTLLATDDIASWPWCLQCPQNEPWPCPAEAKSSHTPLASQEERGTPAAAGPLWDSTPVSPTAKYVETSNAADDTVPAFPCVDTNAIPFITALDATDIAITGEGSRGTPNNYPALPGSDGIPRPGTPVIDGRGALWTAANFNYNTTNKTLHDLLHKHRPHVIQMVNCSNVRLAGFFIHDSPM